IASSAVLSASGLPAKQDIPDRPAVVSYLKRRHDRHELLAGFSHCWIFVGRGKRCRIVMRPARRQSILSIVTGPTPQARSHFGRGQPTKRQRRAYAICPGMVVGAKLLLLSEKGQRH